MSKEELIDNATLSQVTEVLKDTFDETINVFFTQNQKKIMMLHQALGKNDIEQLKIVGHQLKSSSANFGFKRLSSLCRDLEKNSDKLDKNELSDLLQEIETTFFDTKRVLENR